VGALNDIELLTGCCSFLLPKIDDAEREAAKLLEVSSYTVALNSLRSFRIQRAVIAVGMFSMFESALQAENEWADPFKELKCLLNEKGLQELATRFDHYRLAINVLKHGEGQSFDRLFAHQDILEFDIKQSNDWFDGEGDITESQFLIDADGNFVLACAELIQEIYNEVRVL